MEDYDVFNEMQNLKNKKVIAFVEDNENFVLNNLADGGFELIPIRLSYDLSNFSKMYVEKTRELFAYYYNRSNPHNNELARLKKHFVHYQRFPFIAYIPLEDKYFKLIEMLKSLNIECVNDRYVFLNKINNNKKLILIDSDDTLKKSDGTISERAKEAILNHRQLGNIIVICTARPRYQTIEVMKESGANDIIISSNGSEIYDIKNDRIIDTLFVDKNEVLSLVEYAYLNNVRLILTTENYDYVTKEIRNPNQKLLAKDNYVNQLNDINIKQCMFIDKSQEKIYSLKEIIKNNKNIEIVDEIREDDPYEEKWFSVASASASKGSALLKLADYLGIPFKNTIAIGNDKNDLSMFNNCNCSVAVANASKSIKRKVDYVTASNDNDGVAIFLEKILNNNIEYL